ncbi:type VII secretion protein EccCa [Dactylosporangium sp. NPDC050688]|uniref:type VII secretion protein EccCa n=1 Tax=Dactylosporangium sp. NPDC050688 TaxID=3157217 RepID=UPI0033DEBFAF
MSVIQYRRPPRQPGPEMPAGELSLQEPPPLPEHQQNLSSLFMYLPMAIASSATVLLFSRSGAGSGVTMYLAAGLLVVSTIGTVVAQLIKNAGDRKKRVGHERRDYLRYLSQTRKKIRQTITAHRNAQSWQHPDPQLLWSVVRTSRLWERRPTHEDFGEVRIAVGEQRLATRLMPLSTKPIEDLEPLSAHALRRFIAAYSTVADQPVALYLRGYARVLFDGEREAILGMVRALLGQLAVFHSPDDMRVAVCVSDARRSAWDWVKWLPHALHPIEEDGAGPVRQVAGSLGELVGLMGDELTERPPFDPDAEPSRDEPYTVLILDDARIQEGSRLDTSGYRNVTVIDVAETLSWRHHSYALRLEVTAEDVHTVSVEGNREETRDRIGRPDRLSVPRAAALARLLAPYRLSISADVSEPLTANVDLTTLLNIPDLSTHDAVAFWRSRPAAQALRVTIGVAQDGSPIEVDIKESALGGMGPHGMLIGATGSGKSELLRTLVLSMALCHSSESLNFILVDFKGGATFLNLDQLPHTSAVITNLADEVALVARMQDALHGELIRRQELLRAAGNFSSRLEYEQARANGAGLAPLPTLFVVVDEFSELLSAHREFMDLFVMIGRLGRSLGVHLLLASQRLDEGRVHQLETHLSYRISLRTFSAIESRSVLGVPDAYQLPTSPGNGYLKSDVATLTRFKAAYVSGPYRPARRAGRRALIAGQVVPYSVGYVAPRAPLPEAEAPEPVEERVEAKSILLTTVDRLRGVGMPAHRVWLPPLDEPPTLDELMGECGTDPRYGYCVLDAERGTLRVPVGIIDRPFEQRRDPLIADMSGAGGHVAIAGGPQSGKSTLLRSLMLGLALTHTPAEVQFYCLDFGGGTLGTLANLPHVGGVTGRLDPDRVNRTITEIAGMLANRERMFTERGIDSMTTYRRMRAAGELAEERFGDVFLVVDGWSTMRQDYQDQAAQISAIAPRALNYGVHLLIASNRWTDITPALRDQIATRFELKLGDPVESLVNMRMAGSVPRIPGRGLTDGKLHYLTALPRVDGVSDAQSLAEATSAAVEAIRQGWRGPVAQPVRMLPALLHAAELPTPTGDLRVALGVEERELAVAWHDFDESPHLFVVGDAESGKTNVLRLVSHAITARYSPEEAQIALVDFRRELTASVPDEYRLGYAVSIDVVKEIIDGVTAALQARVPGADITPEQLRRRDWWSGPRIFLIVDDYEMLGVNVMRHPFDPLLPLMAQAADIGLHVVVTRAANGASRSMNDQLIRRLLELNTQSLLMSCPLAEGLLFGTIKPRQLPAGRAQRIARREVYLMQTAKAGPDGAR